MTRLLAPIFAALLGFSGALAVYAVAEALCGRNVFAIASPGDPVVTATNTPRSAAVDAGHTGSGL